MPEPPTIVTQRIGLDSIQDVFLVEKHDEAYTLWRDAGAKQRILVHVDTHHDMWWAADRGSVNIANFISRALADELLREVYWVVPDNTWRSLRNRRHVIRHCRKIVKQCPGSDPRPRVERNQVLARVLGRPLRVCSLDSLPNLEESVLLDVDVDFLLLSRVTYGDGDSHESLPWCWPEQLLARLRPQNLRAELVTIAYSVEGGYTPLKWKYLGDELALRVKNPHAEDANIQGMVRMREAAQAAEQGDCAMAEQKYREARALLPGSAAPSWHLADLYIAIDRTGDARRMYEEALALDPSYRSPYSSAGLWQYWRNGFRAAEQEYRRTLALDPQDAYAHLGLARIAIRNKQWNEALELLRKAIELDARLLDAYRALGDVLMKLNRREEAIAAYEQSLKLALLGQRPLGAPITAEEPKYLSDPEHWRVYLRLARLYRLKGAATEAIGRYRMSAAGGCDGVLLRTCLVRLYLKQGDLPQALEEARQVAKQLPRALVQKVGSALARVRMATQYAYEAWLAR